MFNIQTFRRPSAFHAPAYFWLLYASLDEDEVRRQLRDMAKHGARSVCPHPMPAGFRPWFKSTLEPYLSEEYFKKYQAIVDECARLHMHCYLYDEGGWPSGGACGQVYASDPERFARRCIAPDGKGGWKLEALRIYPGVAPLPDILAPGATEKFLELTHERYFRHFSKDFGRVFHAAFTDEPAMASGGEGRLPWTGDAFTEFRRRKGYDVEPLLPAMLSDPFSTAGIRGRVDYTDVMSQLFAERYLRPLARWCRKHGILSGGHFDGEDEQRGCYARPHGGAILRVLRELDLPGIDVIWRQIWPGLRLHPFPKFASSAANQTGRRHAFGEVFGIFGCGIAPEEMRSVCDFLAVCGINMFILGSIPFATRGNMQGMRPFFGPTNPLWPMLKNWNDYLARLSHLGALGRPEVKTALFFDTRTLWSDPYTMAYVEAQDKIACRLMESQCDFDFVDDDLLETARLRGGKLCAGNARYEVLVLPANAQMSDKARARVEYLRRRGFNVLDADESGKLVPTLKVEPADWRLLVRKRVLPGGDALYFVFNSSCVTVERQIHAPEQESSVARCDLESGRLFRVKGDSSAWSWSFPPRSMTVFLVGKAAEKAEPAPAPAQKVLEEFPRGWRLRPLTRITAGSEDYIHERCRTKAKAVRPGDWRPALGDSFSGTALYTLDFDGTHLTDARALDLGSVRYGASVKLNGVPLGVRIWPPYEFDVAGHVLPGRNHLEIEVANTLANAISPDDVEQRWKQQPFANPYEDRERRFEAEHMESGLFGPVRLKK